ncbi:MAG: site-2 protease family protein [Caulobacterales bacterium 68-7]|nr:site-2 protease family protein [Caulobacterales bacterium]OJU12699.1 MAG: site-2 protease family protein [Caulobacterales bacterium 68-7]
MTAEALRPSAPRPGLSRNGMILIGVTLALGAALVLAPSRILVFAFVLAGWVLSVAIHEFCHAFAAWRAGDHSVSERGYLSFDPLKYADLGTSIVLPILILALGGIGFPGGAVYLRNDLMRTRGGRAFASLAGPLGTLACLVAYAAGVYAASMAQALGLAAALAFLAFLQATALFINLLPIPGLDGFGVIRPYLPDSAQPMVNKAGALVGVALLLIIFFVPGASDFIFRVGLTLTDLAAVPREAIAAGHDAFTFWN